MSNFMKGQALKYGLIALGGYLIYRKLKSTAGEVIEYAGEVASTKLNPASSENLVFSGVKAVAGDDAVGEAGLSFFDTIDSVAEFFGSENGINGVPGTTRDLTAAVQAGTATDPRAGRG